MSRIRPRPMVHRHEPVRDLVNEADHARMMQKLMARSSAVEGRPVKPVVAGSNPAVPATQLGLSITPTGLGRESPGLPLAEETATAGGGETESRMASYPPLAIGPDLSPSNLDDSRNRDTDAVLGDAGAERRSIRPGGSEQSAVSMAPIDDSSGESYDASGLPDGAKPSPIAVALEWERAGQYAMRTLCGTWTCCKVTVGGHIHYELWRRIAGLERPARALWDFLSFESAKEAAQNEMD